jgi:hypothetical protein
MWEQKQLEISNKKEFSSEIKSVFSSSIEILLAVLNMR